MMSWRSGCGHLQGPRSQQARACGGNSTHWGEEDRNGNNKAAIPSIVLGEVCLDLLSWKVCAKKLSMSGWVRLRRIINSYGRKSIFTDIYSGAFSRITQNTTLRLSECHVFTEITNILLHIVMHRKYMYSVFVWKVFKWQAALFNLLKWSLLEDFPLQKAIKARMCLLITATLLWFFQ